MIDPKTTLTKLNQNLNILQEREAKYGGNVPLELLNQIDDHRQAIDLTRQAVTGELSQVEWQETLKPLLLALRDGQVVNVQAGTYVAGDQIITNIYNAPPLPLPPAEAKERHDLTILLNKVKTFWIEGVLEKSVHNIALIDLGKETQAEAVAHAWEQVLELPDQSRQTLPPDKKISQIFDEMNRALLILGLPGSGKTITLLQLARDLIAQAEQDESFAQPVPVVFNLSTWRKGQPLIEWLVAELSAKYQIPKRIGRPWLENNRLLPLLDGLDEVREEERVACVEAINRFETDYGLSGLAVCSRVDEYTSLPVRLTLNGAIRLQPLTLEQVYDYLDAAGSRLEALRVALEADDSLQTLAQTPLTLGIMILAYQNIPLDDLTGQVNKRLEIRRRHLLDTYIERMFRRKGQSRPYPDDRTKAWLLWLAQGMRRHNQGIFLIEQLQPSWLSSRGWVWVYLFGSRLCIGLISGLMVGLVMGLSASWLMTRTELRISGLGYWFMFGLIWGLTIGVLLALIDGFRLEYRTKAATPEETPFVPEIFSVLVIWLILGTANGLIFGLLLNEPFFGVAAAFLFGVAGTVFSWLRGRHQSLTNDIHTVEALSWSWRKARKLVPYGLLVGVIYGLFTASIFFGNRPDFMLTVMKDAPVFRLLGERGFFLSEGVFWALFGGVGAALLGGLSSQVEASKTVPNQGILLTLRNALLIGLGFGPLVGLLVGLLNGLFYGSWPVALSIGLVFLIGVGTVAFGIYGGVDVIQHYTLRIILWYRGQAPFIYFRFLNYAVEKIFLQRVGGGYIFIHRLLLEHFAAMNETMDQAEDTIDTRAIKVN